MSAPVFPSSSATEIALRLLQASSCFRPGAACGSLPCACAQSLVDALSPTGGDEDLEDFHDEIREAVIQAAEAVRNDDIRAAHRVLAQGARRAAISPQAQAGEPTQLLSGAQPSSGTEQCPYDGGFDAEIGPIGCCLDLDGMHGCVCRRFTPQIAGDVQAIALAKDLERIADKHLGLTSDIKAARNAASFLRALSPPQAQAGETREKAEAWVWKDGIPAPAEAAPLTHRWRPPGASTWIYDPEPEWLEDHKFEVEWEPVYGAPQPMDIAQGQSDRGEDDPYITDLKFAIEQNIKAARKYKARLDFMEVKYGAIDWDGTASPPAPLPAGQVVVTPEMVSAGMAEIPEDGAEYEHVEAAYRKMAALAIPSTNSNTGEFENQETDPAYFKPDRWTVDQFWQFAEGLTDAHVRDQLRDAMAERGLSITSTPRATPPDWKQDQAETTRLPPNRPLCSCKASQRDGQHMAWCPAVTSTNETGGA